MKTITIGRSSQCDIILSGDKISRVHAEISVVNGQYVYYDRSANGSNIGGQIIYNKKVVVAPGTTILLANRIPLPWDKVYALLPTSGYRVNEEETQYNKSYPHNQKPEKYSSANPDKLGIGWGILAFLIPLAGWIMYFAWKDDTPNRANAAGIIGILSFVLGILPFLF